MIKYLYSRWNSEFYAWKRVHKFLKEKKQEVVQLLQELGLPGIRPTEEEFIREYIITMRPLAEALDILQAQEHACLGYLLPTLTILKNKMASYRTNSAIKICQPLVSCIMKSLDER